MPYFYVIQLAPNVHRPPNISQQQKDAIKQQVMNDIMNGSVRRFYPAYRINNPGYPVKPNPVIPNPVHPVNPWGNLIEKQDKQEYIAADKSDA